MQYIYTIDNVTLETVNALAAFFYMRRDRFPRILLLHGEIGTGKTTFARNYVMSGDEKAAFASPTYSIVRSYEQDGGKVHHFDLYRIDANDYEWIYEYLEDETVVSLFEWGELHPELFTTLDYLEISFVYKTETTRDVTISMPVKYAEQIEEVFEHENIVFAKRD